MPNDGTQATRVTVRISPGLYSSAPVSAMAKPATADSKAIRRAARAFPLGTNPAPARRETKCRSSSRACHSRTVSKTSNAIPVRPPFGSPCPESTGDRSPSTNINANAGNNASRSPVVRSGSELHRSFRGPKKTRSKIISRKIAVMSRPIKESAVAHVERGKAPRKIRNSPGNSLRPGNPKDEKIAMPIRPQKTGTTLRSPPKSFSPRKPPLRFSSRRQTRTTPRPSAHD